MHTLLATLLAGLLLLVGPAPTAPTPEPPAVATVAAAEAATYQIDPLHTQLGFRIRHLGIAFVSGVFDDFEGTITFDPADLSATRAEVTVQTASIDTGVEPRDDHLRSADFFEVETYPTMTFTSTGAQPTGPSTFLLTGDLTIKGITREVVFDATAAGPIEVEEGRRVGFYATTEINRRDFGITWGGNLPNGFPAVGDRVQIILDVEGLIGS